MVKVRKWMIEKETKKQQKKQSKKERFSTPIEPLKKKISKKSDLGVQNNSNIVFDSVAQKDVYNYLFVDFLTPKKIAQLRHTSLKAVYKVIEKLKEKGMIKSIRKGEFLEGGVTPQFTPILNPILNPLKKDFEPLPKKKSHFKKKVKEIPKIFRYHGVSIIVELLESSNYFSKLLERKNIDTYLGNTLHLYPNYLTIYFYKDFWGITVDECVRTALEEIFNYISKLENNYKIVLAKGKKCNIREFRGHIAKIGDPFAREINIKKEHFRIHDENGVLRLLVDNSFKFEELEAVSSKYAISDMKSLEEKWLDLLKTNLKLSDVGDQITKFQDIVEILKNTDATIFEYVDVKANQTLNIVMKMFETQNSNTNKTFEVQNINIMKIFELYNMNFNKLMQSHEFLMQQTTNQSILIQQLEQIISVILEEIQKIKEGDKFRYF